MTYRLFESGLDVPHFAPLHPQRRAGKHLSRETRLKASSDVLRGFAAGGTPLDVSCREAGAVAELDRLAGAAIASGARTLILGGAALTGMAELLGAKAHVIDCMDATVRADLGAGAFSLKARSDLGFLGPRLFHFGIPPNQGLEKLGFPPRAFPDREHTGMGPESRVAWRGSTIG